MKDSVSGLPGGIGEFMVDDRQPNLRKASYPGN